MFIVLQGNKQDITSLGTICEPRIHVEILFWVHYKKFPETANIMDALQYARELEGVQRSLDSVPFPKDNMARRLVYNFTFRPAYCMLKELDKGYMPAEDDMNRNLEAYKRLVDAFLNGPVLTPEALADSKIVMDHVEKARTLLAKAANP